MKILAALALLAAGTVTAVVLWLRDPESKSPGALQPDEKKSDSPAAKDHPKTKAEPVALTQGKTAQEPKQTPGEFRFTDDIVGRRLAEYLPPELASIKPAVRKPLALPGPRFLEKPEAPLEMPPLAPIRPALPSRPPAKPANPVEEAPLDKTFALPQLPEAIEFPTSPLARIAGPNAEAPLPLPILAQPNRDRAALGDPSLDHSIATALSAPMPVRTQPVPFAPMNLPNPFEHHGPARLRTTPPEDTTPPLVTPRPPGK